MKTLFNIIWWKLFAIFIGILAFSICVVWCIDFVHKAKDNAKLVGVYERVVNKQDSALESLWAYEGMLQAVEGKVKTVSIVTGYPVAKVAENGLVMPERDIESYRYCMISSDLYITYSYLNDEIIIVNGNLIDGTGLPYEITGSWKVVDIDYEHQGLITLYHSNIGYKIESSDVIFR